MAGETELPGLPQPPKRSPPGGVVVRKILKVKKKRQGFIGPRRIGRAQGGRPKRGRMHGPAAPKNHKRLLRKEARAGRISTRQFKAMVARGHRAIATGARKAAKAQARGKSRPKRGKPAIGRRRGGGARRGGYARSKSPGMLPWLIKLARKALKVGRRSNDFRNHGFTKSGHGGRTGFAGMKPRGRLW